VDWVGGLKGAEVVGRENDGQKCRW